MMLNGCPSGKIAYSSAQAAWDLICRYNLLRLDWVVCGGESGVGARPIQRGWIDQLRHDCKQWDVPFFFKQWSGPKAGDNALPDGAEVKAWPQSP